MRSRVWIMALGLATLLSARPTPFTEAAAQGGAPSEPATVRLLRSDATGVVIEIDAPWPEVTEEAGLGRWTVPSSLEGWTRLEETGKPDLPLATLQIGLPPNARPVVTAQVLSERILPGPEPVAVPRYVMVPGKDGFASEEALPARDDAAFAAEYPDRWVEVGEVGVLRHIRTAGLRIYPYHWDPSAGGLRYAQRLRVEVRFEAQPPSEQEKGIARRKPGAEDDSWSRLYRRTLLNADDALNWRSAPARYGASLRGTDQKSYFDGPEVRIRVKRSDVYRVTQVALAAAGWETGSMPVDQLALVERFYLPSDPVDPFREQPVPILVRDLDGDGAFGPGDDFLFFGLSAWDRLHPAPRDKRYGRAHAYFLSARSEGGARFATATSYLDRTDLPVNTTALWSRHYEDADSTYMFQDVDGSLTPDLGADFEGALESIRNEHMYWTGGSHGDTFGVAFDLPGLVSLEQFRVRLQRTSRAESSPTARVTVRAGCGANGAFADLFGSLLFTSREGFLGTLGAPELAGLELCPRNDYLHLIIPEDQYSCALDWFEWTWRRDLLAEDGRLAFQAAVQTDAQEYRLLNFGAADTTGLDRVLLFDLSDSARTETGMGPVRLTWRDDQYDGAVLRLQLEANGSGRPRPILAVTPNAAAPVAPVDLALLDPSDPAYGGGYDLRQPIDGDEELICIVHPDFAAGIEPLLAQRRSQGLNVRKVLIDQVYDQFNGGRPAPTAIRNYLRYLFSPAVRSSAPSYLLLVGDASDDFAGGLRDSGRNFVPTQTLFASVYSTNAHDLISCDYWYVDRLSDLGERFDFRPDMHIGRLPVGNEQELTAVVEKLLDYDRVAETDSWRARGLFIADDEFSSTISFSESYRWNGDAGNPIRQGGESRFRWTAWQAQNIIQEQAGFQEFSCDSFFTATYMDTVAGNWTYEGHPVDMKRCRGNVNPCPTWSCPAPGFTPPDSTHACFNTVGAPYVGFFEGHLIPNEGWWESNFWYGRRKVNPLLRQALTRGFLFANYQGHANSHLLSHEYILMAYTGLLQDDTQNLQNEDKPFVFFGFGCHLAEFSVYDEGSPSRGDALLERMLFLDRGRGAVAALGSSGYEWINTTEQLNLAIFRSWFRDPPTGPDGQPRWILGEILSQAKANMIGTGGRNQVPTYNLLGDPSMPMEMAPPRFEVFLDCIPGTTGCEPYQEGGLHAPAGEDSLWIRSRLADESGLREVVLRDTTGVVDTSRYEVGEDPLRPGDLKRRLLSYHCPLDVPFEDYEIRLEVKDGTGRTRETALPVVLGVEFQVLQSGAPRPLLPDDILEAGDSLQVTTDLPIDVLPEDVTLWLDDQPLPATRTPDSDLRRHGLRAVLPELAEGGRVLRLRVARRDGRVAERQASFQGPTVGTHLIEAYTFPNPFEDGTEVIYRLSSDGTSARLAVFTAAGRRIWSTEGPAQSGRNSIWWDGRDADGDPVANGVYLYKLEIGTREGGRLRRIGRIARIR